MFLWTAAGGALYGITGVLIWGLFATKVRYRGISLSYQLAGILGGALAPIIATALVGWAGGVSWPATVYLVLLAGVSLLCVYLSSERYSFVEDSP